MSIPNVGDRIHIAGRADAEIVAVDGQSRVVTVDELPPNTEAGDVVQHIPDYVRTRTSGAGDFRGLERKEAL